MTRKRHLTSRIKPATKHALMAQLALAASEIERLRTVVNGRLTRADVAFLAGAAVGMFSAFMGRIAS